MKSRLRRLPLVSLSFVVLLSAGLRGAEGAMTAAPAASVRKPYPTHFAKPTSVDCARVLPAPPAPDSLAGKADLMAVLQVQAWRTTEQIAWAKRVDKNDAFLSAEVLGPWFARDRLPLTAAFLKDVDEDRHEITEIAKNLFARARPWTIDPRVEPCVGKPSNLSYPSGHASSLYTRAGVLAEIFPERRAALFAFAERAVWGRIHAGVHFPTDVVGGRLLGEAIVVELKKSPEFSRRLAEVRAEVAAHAAK